MMFPDTYSNPPRLWLAAAPPQGGDELGQQDDGQALDLRSLRTMIVEDEFFISLHTKTLLQALGHVVVGIAVSADEAARIAEREHPDVALMDIRLVGARDGIAAAEEIFNRFGVPSIFVTANTDPQTRGRAQAVQPLGFLEKPLTEERLKIGLRHVPTT
jgi:two-component system, response regulator PdtaR